MGVLVRHYLNIEPAQSMEELMEQYTEALFIEDRQMMVMAAAIGKAFSSGK